MITSTENPLKWNKSDASPFLRNYLDKDAVVLNSKSFWLFKTKNNPIPYPSALSK